MSGRWLSSQSRSIGRSMSTIASSSDLRPVPGSFDTAAEGCGDTANPIASAPSADWAAATGSCPRSAATASFNAAVVEEAVEAVFVDAPFSVVDDGAAAVTATTSGSAAVTRFGAGTRTGSTVRNSDPIEIGAGRGLVMPIDSAVDGMNAPKSGVGLNAAGGGFCAGGAEKADASDGITLAASTDFETDDGGVDAPAELLSTVGAGSGTIGRNVGGEAGAAITDDGAPKLGVTGAGALSTRSAMSSWNEAVDIELTGTAVGANSRTISLSRVDEGDGVAGRCG